MLLLPDVLIEHVLTCLHAFDQLLAAQSCRGMLAAVERLARHVLEGLEQRADESFRFRAGMLLARFCGCDAANLSTFPYRCMAAAARRCHLYELGGSRAPGVVFLALTADGQLLSSGHRRQSGFSWPTKGLGIDVWSTSRRAHITQLLVDLEPDEVQPPDAARATRELERRFPFNGAKMLVSGTKLAVLPKMEEMEEQRQLNVFDLDTMEPLEGFNPPLWADIEPDAFTVAGNDVYSLAEDLVQKWALTTGELVSEAVMPWGTPGYPCMLFANATHLFISLPVDDSREVDASYLGLHILSTETFESIDYHASVDSYAADETRLVTLDQTGRVTVSDIVSLVQMCSFRVRPSDSKECEAKVEMLFKGLAYFIFSVASGPLSPEASANYQHSRIEAWDMQSKCLMRVLRWPQCHVSPYTGVRRAHGPDSLLTDGYELFAGFNSEDQSLPRAGSIKVWAL